MIDPATFRANLKAFANSNTYPDEMIQFWLTTAYARLPVKLWSTNLDLGAQFYAAHELVLEVRSNAASANGAIPGETVGAISSKSVSSVSTGYDTGSTSERDAGYYNQTTYGKRFWTLAQIAGTTGITLVGAPSC